MVFSIKMQAQTSGESLNQIELMKQWVGNWKAEHGKDTVWTIEVKPFNNAFEFYAKCEAQGVKVTEMEWKKLIGYDEQNDRFIEAIIHNNHPELILMSLRFRTPTVVEEVDMANFAHPENAWIIRRVEFKSQDLFTWTNIVNGKVKQVSTFKRLPK